MLKMLQQNAHNYSIFLNSSQFTTFFIVGFNLTSAHAALSFQTRGGEGGWKEGGGRERGGVYGQGGKWRGGRGLEARGT